MDAVSPCRQDTGVVHFICFNPKICASSHQNLFLLKFGLDGPLLSLLLIYVLVVTKKNEEQEWKPDARVSQKFARYKLFFKIIASKTQ